MVVWKGVGYSGWQGGGQGRALISSHRGWCKPNSLARETWGQNIGAFGT